MTSLPRVSGGECIAALTKVGFRVLRQEGSHIILRRDEPFAQRQAGPSVARFVALR